MALDDAAIVGRCLQGDRDAFGDLVRRYEHAVYGLALSYLRDFAAAEDLAQEAFVSAYLNLTNLKEPTRFGPWVKATVVNLCKNELRSRNTEKATLAQQAGENPMGQDPQTPDRARGPGPQIACPGSHRTALGGEPTGCHPLLHQRTQFSRDQRVPRHVGRCDRPATAPRTRTAEGGNDGHS